MEIDKIIESAKQISDFCKNYKTCNGCPFFIRNEDEEYCLFRHNLPMDWQFDKLNKEKDILFLLSKEEAEESFDKEQLKWKWSWWLSSVSHNLSGYVWHAYSDGSLNYYYVNTIVGVRPAFKANILKQNPDTITIGNTLGNDMKWRLSKDKQYYLLDNYIFSTVFDETDNTNYEESSIKRTIKGMEKAFLEDAKEKELLKEDRK